MSWDDGKPYLEELAPGVHGWVQPDGGWMVNNTGLVADRSGAAVLVDTHATEARTRAFLAAVAEVVPGVPRAAVNTHHHPDHTYGNGFLPAETLVVGQDRCRDEILLAGLEATQVIRQPEYGALALRPPEVTFADRLTLHLEFPVELRHVGRPAHTNNDVLVWLPEQRVLFAGDLAFNGGQPFVLEGSVAGYRSALAQMRALEPDVLLPGHGPACRGEDVAALLDRLDGYLTFVQDVASSSYAEGLSPLEAATRHRDNPYAGWAESERLVGNLHRAYSELAGEPEGTRIAMATAWPEMVAFHGGPIGCRA